MYFAMWTWTWVLGALLVTSALVVLVHLLRLRRRRVEVAHLPLFAEALGDSASARRVDWIRRLLALLLSLGIVAALVLALGDPRFERDEGGRAVIILVDRGFSMRAAHEGRSRLEEAKEEARALVRGLGPDDSAAVVAVGEAPLPLSALTGDVQALDHAIDAIAPGHGAADLRAAFALAADMLAGLEGGEIVVVGDGFDEPIAPPEGVKLFGVRVGARAENLAIEAFATRRLPLDPSRAAVLLRVSNQGPSRRSARVELRSETALIDAHELELDPGEALTLDLADVPVLDAKLVARIVPLDDIVEALTEDDVAYAAIAPRRDLRVHVVSPGNLYLEAALLLDPTLRVSESEPAEPLPSEPVDLFVFDRAAPPSPVSTPAIYIAPPEGGAHLPIGLGRRIEGPHLERIAERERLVEGLRLFDVNIAEARALSLARGDVALARHGAAPLLASGERDGVPFVALGFAIEESDLPLRIAWPLFLMRAVDALTGRGAYHVPVDAAGEAAEVALSGDASVATWTAPSGLSRDLTVSEGSVRLVPVEPGVHTLSAGGEVRELVVARPRTASLGAPSSPELSPPPEGREAPSARPLFILLGIALALLSLEHLMFHRRLVE